MADLPPGWATDVAVLRLTGSQVDEHPTCLVVRTPDNPAYRWGNFVLVTDPARVDDAPHWDALTRTLFPGAGWASVGLVRPPDDDGAWRALGYTVDVDDVLVTTDLPAGRPLPDGYTVRPLAGADWEQAVALAVAENARTREHAPDEFETFTRARTATRAALSAAGDAAWFGAFTADGDALVADLGIVVCGADARYQDVGTDAAHRGRGLAGHLLGAAARWAAGHGCTRWVIVTEATNPAGRLYRSVGFAPDVGNAQAYRWPPAAG